MKVKYIQEIELEDEDYKSITCPGNICYMCNSDASIKNALNSQRRAFYTKIQEAFRLGISVGKQQ